MSLSTIYGKMYKNDLYMMNWIYIAHFLLSIFKYTLRSLFKSCWLDQTSAYEGAAGSYYQSISDLT